MTDLYKMAEEIVGLSLLQAHELKSILKEKYN
ncbi:MAG: 50S ribosomal protein L7/L12, partial [Paracoccaceae bacterium]